MNKFNDQNFPKIPGLLLNLEETREIQYILNELLNKKISKFPGSQPVSFEQKHLKNNLINEDYLVCEKTDGLRCLLLILNDSIRGEGIFLITREFNIYLIQNIHFPLNMNDDNHNKSYHNGSLLDGELVLENKNIDKPILRFCIFDGLVINRKIIYDRPLYKRLGYVTENIMKPYDNYKTKKTDFHNNTYPFKISFKIMMCSYKANEVLKNKTNLFHHSDGLIFTCVNSPYIFGTDNKLLKWKPPEENSVDFKMEIIFNEFHDTTLDENDINYKYIDYDSKPNLINLKAWQGGNKYQDFGKLFITDEEWEELKNINEPLQGRIIECKKSQKKSNYWELLRFRNDKQNGNHINVIEKILLSINDGISENEIIESCPSIFESWSKRIKNGEKNLSSNY